ncbi:early nodulin-like protein 2 [Panicum miliaceum]|uniref:Early nodulin-like protein 2 n=1 Tax=Panicum miliaceum TaxID=4540 RepID=A0A3L6S2N0_PANMI|nr:early nodulin-like protein 2 [Panicum miliaceum]
MAGSLGLGLACFALVVAAASATQFRVGGQKGWSVPGAGFEPYNTWAGRLRFQIGDQLLFVYPKETDSVLLVEPAAYNACNVSSYLQKFDDGSTVFTLDRSGPFFFISGNEASCRANEKLIVVVLADRTGARTPPGAPPMMSPPSPAPLPSPSSSPPPAAAPALSPASPPPSGAAPLPAPAATPTSPPSPAVSAPGPAPTTTPGSPPAPMAPSPSTTPGGGASQPPSASANAPGAEGNATPPPPSASDTNTNAAAPVVAGFVGSLGAIIGYAMLAA